MRIGSWFLKIVIGLISLVVIAIAVIPLPQMTVAVLTKAPAALHVVGGILAVGGYIFLLAFLGAAWCAEKLLLVIDRNLAFSRQAVQLLARIKWCVTLMAVGALLWLPFLFKIVQMEDAPGLMLMALAVIAVPIVMAVFLAVLQRLWSSALDYKEENDLTI
jgi:hypothetical protein